MLCLRHSFVVKDKSYERIISATASFLAGTRNLMIGIYDALFLSLAFVSSLIKDPWSEPGMTCCGRRAFFVVDVF